MEVRNGNIKVKLMPVAEGSDLGPINFALLEQTGCDAFPKGRRELAFARVYRRMMCRETFGESFTTCETVSGM